MNISTAMKGSEPAVPAKKKAGDNQELESIHIDLAENGFTVRVHYAPKKRKGKNPEAVAYVEPESYVFESPESTASFVKEMLT